MYYRENGYNNAKVTAIKLANYQKIPLNSLHLHIDKSICSSITNQRTAQMRILKKIPLFNYFLEPASVSFSECFQQWKFYLEMFEFLFNLKALEAWNVKELPKLCSDLSTPPAAK